MRHVITTYICDRCGREYHQESDVGKVEITKGHWGIGCHSKFYDICNKCIGSLEKWMEEGFIKRVCDDSMKCVENFVKEHEA